MKKNKPTVTAKSSIPQEIDPDYFHPLEVKVFGNGFERAMKTFRTIVQSEKVLSEYKEKSRYEKPSDKKRRKKAESIKKAHEEEIKMKKIISGEYEKERAKKQVRKEQKMKQKAMRSKDLGDV